MSDEKRISNLTDKTGIVARKQQSELTKKLEAIVGKPLNTGKSQGFVYLLIDCSYSMEHKLEQAKNGGKGFAEEAHTKGYAIGLIRFDSDAQHLLAPERELAKFNSTIRSLTANGSTNMAEGIQISIQHLSGKNGERVICIVTDGQPDDKETTLKAANEAKKSGIEIMTLGVDGADKSFLEQLATRKELAVKVETKQLQQGIASMAKMLPNKT